MSLVIPFQDKLIEQERAFNQTIKRMNQTMQKNDALEYWFLVAKSSPVHSMDHCYAIEKFINAELQLMLNKSHFILQLQKMSLSLQSIAISTVQGVGTSPTKSDLLKRGINKGDTRESTFELSINHIRNEYQMLQVIINEIRSEELYHNEINQHQDVIDSIVYLIDLMQEQQLYLSHLYSQLKQDYKQLKKLSYQNKNSESENLLLSVTSSFVL